MTRHMTPCGADHARRAQATPRLVMGLALLVLASCGVPPAAKADPGIVIGDSIGNAMASIIGLRSAARTSFSVRRHDLRSQLRRVPKGSIALLSLGLNDGAAPVPHLQPSIERAIKHINASGHRVVWIGPPCVFKRWDNRAQAIDEFLAKRLASTDIQYVSLRDDKICNRRMRTRDGEHFKPSGYRYIWKKIQADSSWAAKIKL